MINTKTMFKTNKYTLCILHVMTPCVPHFDAC